MDFLRRIARQYFLFFVQWLHFYQYFGVHPSLSCLCWYSLYVKPSNHNFILLCWRTLQNEIHYFSHNWLLNSIIWLCLNKIPTSNEIIHTTTPLVNRCWNYQNSIWWKAVKSWSKKYSDQLSTTALVRRNATKKSENSCFFLN